MIISGIKRSKRATEEVLHGTDWESVNYSLTKLQCNEDEITGLCVNDKYLVIIYPSLSSRITVKFRAEARLV